MSDPKKNLMFYGLTLVLVSAAALLSAFASAGDPKPAGPSLGRAASFVVLGGSTVTSTGATAITGDLGVSSPGVSVTGFPPGTMARGAQHVGDPVANQAQADAQSAYAVLAGKPCTAPLTGQDLGGKTLAPGVYCFTSSAQLTGRLVLDGGGKGGKGVWIFQIASTLTTATNSSVVMSKGGRAGNVFWQVGSAATLGTGTAFMGNILAYSSITMNTAANLSGRALARDAVTMDSNNIQAPPEK
jgi:Ice-binding-like